MAIADQRDRRPLIAVGLCLHMYAAIYHGVEGLVLVSAVWRVTELTDKMSEGIIYQ